MQRLFIFVVSMILISAYSVFAAAADFPYMPNQVLVRYKPSVAVAERNQEIRKAGMKILRSVYQLKGQTEILVVKTAANETVEQTIERMSKNANVDLVEKDYMLYASAVPNDTLYTHLWGQKNTAQNVYWSTVGTISGPDFPSTNNQPGVSGVDMNLETAWDKRTDCSSTIVAVVDTGVRYDHEDLASNMWMSGVGTIANHGWDFGSNDNNPMDEEGHGTHVAGTIAAKGNNGKGVAGVCWNAKIMAVKVFASGGSTSNSVVASGINFATSNGAKVINLSLGGGTFSASLNTAIASAGSNDVVIVSAAGNDNTNNTTIPQWPCKYSETNPNNICIASIGQDGNKSTFSNYGVNAVQLAAPGTNIMSTWPSTRTSSGTLNLNSMVPTTNTATAWGLQTWSGAPALAIPTPWNGTSNTYANSTTALATFTIDNTGGEAMWLHYYHANNIQSGDVLRVFANSGTTSVVSGGTLATYSGVANGASAYEHTVPRDASTWCKNTVCQVGFQLTTDGSGQSYGSAFRNITVTKFAMGTTGYNVISGTSMATPQVAGLATLIRAQNPNYNARDVVNALKGGGRTLSSLSGQVQTGKTADAPGSLAFINAPTGVVVSQAP